MYKDEKFKQVDSSYNVYQDERMMEAREFKAPITQAYQDDDCEMNGSQLNPTGFTSGLMNATNSITQRHKSNSFLGKRQTNKPSSTSKLELDYKTPIKTSLKEAVAVSMDDTYTVTEKQSDLKLR